MPFPAVIAGTWFFGFVLMMAGAVLGFGMGRRARKPRLGSPGRGFGLSSGFERGQ